MTWFRNDSCIILKQYMIRSAFSPILSLFVLLAFTTCTRNIVREYTPGEVLTLHESVLTIDSHTDTPLRIMRPGTDLGSRGDSRKRDGKVDFIRMKEGGLDGIFFAVFVGQSARNPQGNEKARVLAMRLFDSIHAVVDRYPDLVELALDSRDLKRISSTGKRAIFIGIENGYVLGHDLDLVEEYYKRGTRYITLCHTANNDICDSSTDSDGPEHGGLSEFGREVVREMNRLGIMIDVSHISDQAFYGVLEISESPVMASHSNARALCESPRNLDDEMIKALAEKGGVIQLCLVNSYITELPPNPKRDSARQALRLKYGDFDEPDDSIRSLMIGEWYALDDLYPRHLATVPQFVDHVDHVVDLVGIDHVGFGSDFDGGAGIDGCYDVKEIPGITAEMLSRGYNRHDLEKFWSGNLLRVMEQVEQAAL